MIKTFFLLFFFATSLAAQPVFQKKIEGLELAEGLTLLPDNGYVLAGLKGNCIQIIRFDAAGSPLWMQQVCPSNPNADLSIRSVQIVADASIQGAFLLIFRKGAFASAPDNLLNIMKFDAAGGLQWESQLRPEKRYGPFTPGSQLSVTPSGTIWATHGMGFTNGFPDFNQALVFKINTSGQILLRRFFMTDQPATANGIAAKNNQEVFVYGALGHAITDGFLLKINESGEIIWSKRYGGMHFIRDGGFFPNGDLLLMAEHNNAYALARITPAGSMVWAAKIPDTLNLFHCAVAADGGVMVAGRKPNGLSMLFKINTGSDLVAWAKTYEACSRYQTTALRCPADGGFICAQSTTTGLPRTRFFKGNNLGQLSPECSIFETTPPVLEAIPVAVFPQPFSFSDGTTQAAEHFFKLTETSIAIKDCCPTEYPDARFVLPDSVCANAPFSLVSAGNLCADEWRWQIPGALPEEAQGTEFQDIVCEISGDFPITLTESIGVCSDTFSGILHVVTPPAAEIFTHSDTVICPDMPFVLRPNLEGFDTWVWDDGSTEVTRFFDLPKAGTFRLFGQKGYCSVSDSIKIEWGNCGPTRVFVPNAFSPNDDGQNDYWEIFAPLGVRALGCQVFDRWGNLCYATATGEIPRWNGRFKDRPMPEGVYIWQFRLRNAEEKEEILSGDLLLFR